MCSLFSISAIAVPRDCRVHPHPRPSPLTAFTSASTMPPSQPSFVRPILLHPSDSLHSHHALNPPIPLACARAPNPAKDISLPPSRVNSSALPASFLSTTIIYNIPSLPPHLPPPLSHPLDADGHILALSFQPSATLWPRARFVRTKPFMAESKACERIYRGLYGTPPTTSSWNAPIKPKASSARGVFMWGKGKKRRAFAWGIRTLPIALDVATLVSKGPTALGAVLTDSPELALERATELVAQPIRRDEELFLAGVGRAKSGRILGAFSVRIDATFEVLTRSPRVQVPRGCEVVDFAVGKSVCVLLMLRVGEGLGKGLLGGLLGSGGGGSGPVVDVEFGTVVVVMPKDGSAAEIHRVDREVVTNVVCVEEGEGLTSLSVLLLRSMGERKNKVNLSMIRDIQCGRVEDASLLHGDCQIKLASLSIDTNSAGRGVSRNLSATLSDVDGLRKDLSLLSVCNPHARADAEGSITVCTTFDHSLQRSGLVVLQLSAAEGATVLGAWLAEEGFDVGRPLMNDDKEYFCIWVTACGPAIEAAARVLIFKITSVDQGPVHTIELNKSDFGTLGYSVGGEWVREAVDWSEEGSKVAKSAYEIFDSRRWNDIESGFSSLGLGQ